MPRRDAHQVPRAKKKGRKAESTRRADRTAFTELELGTQDAEIETLMHAMGPNVAGVIGSAVAAGVMISFFG